MKKTCKLNISNMHCSNCSGAIEKHFNSKEDIKVSVNLADNIGTFSYDEIFYLMSRGISEEEAIQTWLEDNDYEVNEEVAELSDTDRGNGGFGSTGK